MSTWPWPRWLQRRARTCSGAGHVASDARRLARGRPELALVQEDPAAAHALLEGLHLGRVPAGGEGMPSAVGG
eukprot:4604983-Alexandrium_andersonii.AAC.1